MVFNEVLKNLKNYEAGKPIELVVREYGIKDVIKLASNENPFGTSPLVKNALKNASNKAHLYPDDSYFELKEALSAKFSVTPKNLIIGSGSDQIIEFIAHVVLNEKNAILTAGITFAMYEIYASHLGAKTIKTPSQTHDLNQMLEIYKQNKDKIAAIFLCLPNNPLGECLDVSDVYAFMREISPDTLIVIDGAYNDFAKFKDAKKAIDPSDLIKNFKNAIFLGTFSKSYGLGGMRVGYGIADEFIINELAKLRAPFNITTLSLKSAIVALGDDDFVKKTFENNFEQMGVYERFCDEIGVSFIPSFTNFITIKFANSTQICDKLLKQGVILRNLASYGLDAVRITIGTPEQNEIVLNKLREILK
ncbi:histidinol-phosphate transaminase [Campylobacter gastrosuis]|uniref:Histidinol-phosphate aminotransferase n=1 Tax=Campylobacter gastrosuis TaxID=2974576 RepID=A0ABT7HP99_9BACT|nr:histidinol-phosphate transaminase [Campylobacter gastrosuis]MDL0088747.1 histidinol-phosphate transaminase [Campylobacter gastrosuis]